LQALRLKVSARIVVIRPATYSAADRVDHLLVLDV
jgi:hypothetical protein